jgi:hypothetical protein
MRGRRKIEEDWMSSPVPDNGSLRPHVLAASEDEWPPFRRRVRSSQFVAGVVVGMAAALLVTAWAVRTHRWPGSVSIAPASAPPAAQLCPAPAPPRTPPPEVAAVPPAAAPEVASTCNAPAVAGRATDKPHKKGKARAKSLATRAGETRSGTDSSIEHQAAAELAGAPDTEAARPAAHAASPEANAHPEDQAAAELSTSLK